MSLRGGNFLCPNKARFLKSLPSLELSEKCHQTFECIQLSAKWLLRTKMADFLFSCLVLETFFVCPILEDSTQFFVDE